MDIGSLSLSDAEYAALRSAEFDSLVGREADGTGKVAGEAETVRSSNLKFPPKDSGLKIPRSLFLCSSESTDLGDGEGEQGAGEGDHELAEQAEEMVRLMRRSIVLHEYKDRVLWDEDADPQAASEERVRIAFLSGGGGQQRKEGLIREWLESSGFLP